MLLVFQLPIVQPDSTVLSGLPNRTHAQLDFSAQQKLLTSNLIHVLQELTEPPKN